MSIKNTLASMIKNSLEKITTLNPEDINIVVEIPANKDFGDYSTNIALTLTKKLHKSPMDIATEIKENFEVLDVVEDIKIVNPGFINFYLKKDYILSKINYIIEKEKNYGKNNTYIYIFFTNNINRVLKCLFCKGLDRGNLCLG